MSSAAKDALKSLLSRADAGLLLQNVIEPRLANSLTIKPVSSRRATHLADVVAQVLPRSEFAVAIRTWLRAAIAVLFIPDQFDASIQEVIA